MVLIALVAISVSACNYDNDRDLTRGYDNPNMLNGNGNNVNPYMTPNNGDMNNGYNPDNRMRNYNTNGTNRNRANRFRTNANGDANRMASIASRVDGVDDATVIIAGGNAYVGLDLADQVQANQAENVERKVYRSLTRMATRYDINITSDEDLFGRLRDVGDGIRGGNPLNQYQNDFDDFDERFRTFRR